MTDRRTLLRGLAALPLGGLAPRLTRSAEPEPIVGMHRDALTSLALFDAAPDASCEGLYHRWNAIAHEAIGLEVETLPGALACLEWARFEFDRCYVGGEPSPDWLDVFTLKMMDNALAVLRTVVAGQEVGHG